MTNNISTVEFHGQPLCVIHREDQLYIAIKPLCENMGITWEPQRKRIMRDEVLSSTTSMMEAVASDGKNREVVCLPLNYLNGWLFGIDTKRIKNEATRQRVIQYKRECYQVLSDYWLKGTATRNTSSPAPAHDPRPQKTQPYIPAEYSLDHLNLSGHHNLPDARKLIMELERITPFRYQRLIQELEATVVRHWTQVDESIRHLQQVNHYLTKMKGDTEDFHRHQHR